VRRPLRKTVSQTLAGGLASHLAGGLARQLDLVNL
jgi:hypothetical protein